jgi:tRNA 2-selenouridine synthase SelU
VARKKQQQQPHEMIEGTHIVIARAPKECWNGEPGKIHHLFTMHNGEQAAVVSLSKIRLHVCFPLSELDIATTS